MGYMMLTKLTLIVVGLDADRDDHLSYRLVYTWLDGRRPDSLDRTADRDDHTPSRSDPRF